MGSPLEYWNGVGSTKTFTHPLLPEWMERTDRDARVLDYGCGYGRVVAELTDRGFTDVTGVDPSPALVDRGRVLRPDLRLESIVSPPVTHYPAESFDLILLFAVLCCVPDDAAQSALVAELDRLLAPGGVLYVSDVVLQSDERNRSRYDEHARRSEAPYGVFTTDDGATFRHHDIDVLRSRLAGFDSLEQRRLEVGTLNGHRAEAVQFLVRKR